MHRYRNGSGVDAAEETGDKVQTRRTQDQYAFACGALPLQGGRDCPGLDVEFAIREPTFLGPAGREVEGNPVPVAFGPVSHEAQQRCGGGEPPVLCHPVTPF